MNYSISTSVLSKVYATLVAASLLVGLPRCASPTVGRSDCPNHDFRKIFRMSKMSGEKNLAHPVNLMKIVVQDRKR